MEKTSKSVDELMLDSEMSKYEIVKLVAARFNQVKKNAEMSVKTISQIIEKSMEDILTGAVSKEDLEKQPEPQAKTEENKEAASKPSATAKEKTSKKK